MRMRFMRMTAAAGIAVVAGTAGAQVLRGSVVYENTEQKVPNALVTVFDSGGKAVANARADRDGEFLLRVPVAARITVQVTKVGFSPYYIQNLPLGSRDTVNVVVPLTVIAQRLAATVIEAERIHIRQQRILGLDARAISATVITPSEVSLAAKGASSYLDIVRTASPGGVIVDNTRNCVISLHVSSVRPRCLPVFVDEQLISDLDAIAQLAQPELVDHFVFLRGTDAAIKFGNDAIEGVMLIYTRRSEMIRSRAPRP